jgi:hypothetical protein
MSSIERRILLVAMAAWAGVCLWGGVASAATFHVSPSGSNTPPYDTYAKAAHSIQDAVNQTKAADTVRIGAGIYRPDTTIILRDSIVVMGSGPDSTIVAPDKSYRYILRLLGSPSAPAGQRGGGLIVTGCTVRGYDDPVTGGLEQIGVKIDLKDGTPNRICNNSFYSCIDGLQLGYANVIADHNLFDSNQTAIDLSFGGPFDIHHNVIRVHGVSSGINYSLILLGPTSIHHNVVVADYTGGIQTSNWGDSILIYNNLIVNGGGMGLFAHCQCAGGIIRNNTVIRWVPDPGWELAIFNTGSGSHLVIENNSFQSAGTGDTVKLWGSSIRFAYNALWDLGGPDGSGAFTYPLDIVLDTVGNLYRYPMLAPDSMTGISDSSFRLERSSPLIDAGNPAIPDPDGSRSDIGWMGGPQGQTYTYPELPPQPPDSAWDSAVDGIATLNWSSRPEVDLAGYRLYRGATPGFWSPGILPVRQFSAGMTTGVDTIPSGVSGAYYVATAFDTAGLESGPSPEVVVIATDTGGGDTTVIIVPHTPRIIRAYPNPFNSSLVIECYLPPGHAERGQAHIGIYNVLGAKVARLLLGDTGAGYRAAVWDGKDSRGGDSPSGIYIIRLVASGVSEARKVTLVR